MSYANKEPFIPPELYAMLAIRQHTLNQAVGIRRPTSQVIGLLDAYQRKRREETGRFAQAMYLQGQLVVRKKAMKDLVAKIEAGEKIPGAVEQAKRLQLEAEELSGLLRELDTRS